MTPCARCRTRLPDDANYCHACGVSVVAAVSGEYEMFDLDRFFTYALDMLCIAGVDGYFKRVNPAFTRTLGWTAEELLARPFSDLIHPEDRSETVAEVGQLHGGRPTISFENRYRCKDGTYKDLHWTSYPEPGTGLLYAVARDVTEWKRREHRVDTVTGVATRQMFEDRLRTEWSRAVRLKTPLAVLIVDGDDFREFNRVHGYDQGDRCLRQFAILLQDRVRRSGDLIARYGGDAFAIMLDGGLDLEAATAVGETLRRAIAELSMAMPDGGDARFTTSVGVASMLPTRENRFEDLLASAEDALAKAKQGGKNTVVAAS
ncbi:MAG TPA: diguanylate cyclase [Gemmatimonadales bacterium]